MAKRLLVVGLIAAVVLLLACESSPRFEQRNMAAPLRAFSPRFNEAFFNRHPDAFRLGAAFHYAHGRAHDDLQLSPLAEAQYYDAAYDADYVRNTYLPPRMEPTQMYWGPYTGKAAWYLYRTIDWAHHHHEVTYDILSDGGIIWGEKKEWTNRALDVYLDRDSGAALSPAVLEITMRRAGVMMKPYFTGFRNNYPRMATYFYVAHWWHPVVYEAMLIAGNDGEQEVAVRQTGQVMFSEVMNDRPQRMLLSREAMPRYARFSPESANIFDNLHMLHGIAYDIMAYEGWNLEDKRRELYRVIDAMSYKPGDEAYVRKFSTPHPDMDPRVYEEWMQSPDGAMTAIMEDMLREMWPEMDPQGRDEPPAEVMEQLRLKLTPGLQEGEILGSLHAALMHIVPDLHMDGEAMRPGGTPQMMVNIMLGKWHEKQAEVSEVEPYVLLQEPKLPPLPGGEAPEEDEAIPEDEDDMMAEEEALPEEGEADGIEEDEVVDPEADEDAAVEEETPPVVEPEPLAPPEAEEEGDIDIENDELPEEDQNWVEEEQDAVPEDENEERMNGEVNLDDVL